MVQDICEYLLTMDLIRQIGTSCEAASGTRPASSFRVAESLQNVDILDVYSHDDMTLIKLNSPNTIIS